MGCVLVGGGGHARVVFEALVSAGEVVTAYCDPIDQQWLNTRNIRHVQNLQDAPDQKLIMSFLGVTTEALSLRLQKMHELASKGREFQKVIHASALISESATIEDGAQVLAGAIVNAGARVAKGAVVNTGAIVEHDVVVHAGAHIAPGAVVLGGATVGECAFVGAGAVVVQLTNVPTQHFVKALFVYR